MIKKFINVPRNISFNIQCAKKCLLIIILIFSFFQFIYLRFEYPFIQIDWSLHHDEKGTIPDARYYFLKDAKQIDILDYKPHSASAFFGVAGPAIESLGFKIFGMNNIGLRVFFVIIATVTTALFVFLILKITPGMLGLFFSILYVFNFTNFILHRHAILENFLTFFLICILWLYITRPSLLLNNLYKICFVAGTSVLFKPTFAFYVYLLLFLITIVEFKNLRKILRFVLWSFFSILFLSQFNFLYCQKWE